MADVADEAVDQLTSVGHPTALVRSDGVRLITDPVLMRRAAHLRRQPVPSTRR